MPRGIKGSGKAAANGKKFDPAEAEKQIAIANRMFKKNYSNSRDIYTGRVDDWKCAPEVRGKIVVCFHSDEFLSRAAVMEGFIRDIWKPVTPREIQLFGLVFNTKQTRENGQPCYGRTMAAYWCTREEMDYQNSIWKAPFDFDESREQLEKAFQGDISVIGDIGRESSEDIPSNQEFYERIAKSEAVQRQREELGEVFTETEQK